MTMLTKTTDLDELQKNETLKNGAITIDAVYDQNGFSITYLAKTDAGEAITVKELFPSEVCVRVGKSVVSSQGQDEEFKQLRKAFVRDITTLISLDNPNIGGIKEYFEENGTVYFVMDQTEGNNILKAIDAKNFKLNPKQIENLLVKSLLALFDIHAVGLLHREIEPKNIFITPQNEPMLILGFGTFRNKVSNESRAVSKMISSTNQYASMEVIVSPDEQSASSDVYSLAASFYHLIKGSPPPAIMERLSKKVSGGADSYEPLAEYKTDISMPICLTIDLALSTSQEDRIRTASEWLQHLNVSSPKKTVRELPKNYEVIVHEDSIAERIKKNMRRFIIYGTASLALYVLVVFLTKGLG